MHLAGAQTCSPNEKAGHMRSGLPAEARQVRKVLVAEDQYVIALDLSEALERSGVEVLGPVSALDAGLCVLHRNDDIAGAVLDVTMQGSVVYPLADALRRRGVPFVLCTGHSRDHIAAAFRDTVLCVKPLPAAKVVLALQAEMARLLRRRSLDGSAYRLEPNPIGLDHTQLRRTCSGTRSA